jgi:exonuclease III
MTQPLLTQGVVPNQTAPRHNPKSVNGIISIGVLNVQSLSNKTAIIVNTITGRHLDIFCAIETWHDGSDSPSIIASTPPDYKFVEKARYRDNKSSTKLTTNHGGICVFCRSLFRVRTIALPPYNTMEALALTINSSVLSTALIAVYRPGSQHVTSAFFDELSDLIERCSSFSQVIIVGDINIHLDCTESTTSQQFQSLLKDFDFIERVNKQPTHMHRHQLDVFITHHDKPPAAVA